MARTHLEATLAQNRMSQAAFARAMKRPRQTVHEWIAGTGLPTLPDAIATARVLNTTVEQLWPY